MAQLFKANHYLTTFSNSNKNYNYVVCDKCLTMSLTAVVVVICSMTSLMTIEDHIF